jgi:hypothetical protein
MHTILKQWQIVSIFQNESLVGKVLWGICAGDMTGRFTIGDYVCTSAIDAIIPADKTIKTHSGSIYLVEGDGETASIQIEDVELLRRGFSPAEINLLKNSAKTLN